MPEVNKEFLVGSYGELDVSDIRLPYVSPAPECYPIYYIFREIYSSTVYEDVILCPDCANKWLDIDEKLEQLEWEINYENQDLYCDYCGNRIKSAYE